jgi:RNA polymerase sigma-70 factor (ECF subfamily)
LPESDWLAKRFEEHRSRLRGVAYRMLGSLGEADDAVQEAWLRLSRSDASGLRNLAGWLTTVVGRVCLDMLRSRQARREELLGGQDSEPLGIHADGTSPEQELLLVDSVGIALLVVLETLAPEERLAFVLHDLFAVPFDDIAPIVGRSPVATRQLASRARRRVRGAGRARRADLARQREVVEAFLAAARRGDFEALLAVLDPEVVHRVDVAALPPGASAVVRGAQSVARRALAGAQRAPSAPLALALVNGGVGVVMAPGGRLSGAVTFGLRDGRIVEIDVITDPARLRQLHLAVIEG